MLDNHQWGVALMFS